MSSDRTLADDGRPTEQQVLDQLQEILASQGFAQAPQLAAFLRFVVTETVAGRAREIKQYTVATRAFGRTTDFNPESDPIVRITARRLRRALEGYYLTARNAHVHIDIPKGGYVPRIRALVADTSLEAETNAPDDSSRPWDRWEASSIRPSIAILPFTNLGSDPELAYFAVGLTTFIVEELTRYPTVTVMGPLSRERLAETGMDSRAIGREYGVRFVLDGLVRSRRDGVAVSIKLIDADSAATIWADTYDDRDGSAEFVDLEEKIASQAVAAIVDDYGSLSRVLMAESYQRPSDQLQTYDAVMRGIHALTFLEINDLIAAESALKVALESNPTSAQAMGVLADLYAQCYGIGLDRVARTLDDAERLARRAVGHDPTDQNARHALVFVHYLRRRRQACFREIEIMVALNPNRAGMLAVAAQWYAFSGEDKLSLDLLQRAVQLNPHFPSWYHYTSCTIHLHRREYDEALRITHQFSLPDYFVDPLMRAVVLGQLGRREDASNQLNEVRQLRADLFTGAKGGTDLEAVVRRMWIADDLADTIVAGLRHAGLD